MTVRLSPHKATKILIWFFRGMPQKEIAEKAAVHQSTVSIYSSRFKKRVSQIGLLAAGQEFAMFNEVDALRSLSVELSQAGLTVEEAREGLRILKVFMKLGISPEQHAILVKVCKKMNNPSFIHAAVKLGKIEAESKLTYEQVVSRLEKAASELPLVEQKLQQKHAQLESTDKSLSQKKDEVAQLEVSLQQLHNKVETKVAEMEQELAAKTKQMKVKLAEVEETARLKAELAKSGLDIPTLIKLAKEFGDGDSKGK